MSDKETYFNVTKDNTPYDMWVTYSPYSIDISRCKDEIFIYNKRELKNLIDTLTEIYYNHMDDFIDVEENE
jgi:hypothetical protein